MNSHQDILEEYNRHSPKKNNRYQLLIILIIAFICVLNYTLYVDMRRFYFDWMNILLGLVIPGAGLFFLFIKKKAGWFIAVIFFSFIASIFFAALIKWNFFSSPGSIGTLLRVKQFVFFVITAAITILLWTKNIRQLLRINTWQWIISLLIILAVSTWTLLDIL